MATFTDMSRLKKTSRDSHRRTTIKLCNRACCAAAMVLGHKSARKRLDGQKISFLNLFSVMPDTSCRRMGSHTPARFIASATLHLVNVAIVNKFGGADYVRTT